jgi:hypothetical protein
MAKSSNNFFGWLGRQIGYVKKAVNTPVPEVVYRKETVKQAPVPDEQGHVLRRTTVDEVIVQPQKKDQHGVQ